MYYVFSMTIGIKRVKTVIIVTFIAFIEETGANPRDDLPEQLHDEYHRAVHAMGGTTAYRFRKWLDREGIKLTPEKYRYVWKAAQVETAVWNSKDPAACKNEHHHLDMQAAYLACKDSYGRGWRCDRPCA